MVVRSVLIVIIFENDAYVFFISLFVDNRIGGILCSYVKGTVTLQLRESELLLRWAWLYLQGKP